MQTKILNLAPKIPGDADNAETMLTFKPFLKFLKRRREKSLGVRNGYLSYVIEQFEKHPELLERISPEKAVEYQEQLQLIYNSLSPLTEDEDSHYWALSLPLKPVLFYATNAFSNLLSDIISCKTGKVSETTVSEEEMKINQLQFRYSLILEKCFNIPSFFNREKIHAMTDEKTGMNKFYKMKMDIRFIEVHTTKPLPDINIKSLKSRTSYDHQDVLPLLQRIMPLDMFRFEGFGITQISDITSQYAIDSIKNAILNTLDMDEDKCFENITRSLKALVGHNEIEFGILPLLRVNGNLIFDKGMNSDSMIVKLYEHEDSLGEESYLQLAKRYIADPKITVYKEITTADEKRQPFLRLLKKKGVKSYALLPIYFNNSLGGVLEIHSKVPDLLGDTMLAKLDPAMPLLSQLVNTAVHYFEDEIEHVIKEKFTSVQPSVQWKFNEAAWHYLRDKRNTDSKEIEDIEFASVYPLYGAVDIRNSTIERNASLRKDLQVQFTLLIDVLKELKGASGFGLIDEKIFLSQQWLAKVSDPEGFNEEIRLNEFLENNIVPFLSNFQKGNQRYAAITNKYFEAIDEASGIANEHRRSLETSMTAVISAVNFYLESMKGEIQQAYPSYFEKFRTDGVEYDIYIGQSIAPHKPFSDIYLKNLRLLQVTSMAAIGKYSHSLLKGLVVPVETTQLIFVHSNPIDIRFRKDEKRFDVEGAYNIRYHIVKKRIDKIHINGSLERLTQPNKIAIVYFTKQEADEYRGYIDYLQGQGVLKDDIEDLELEEMQGVSGLKALRVGIVI